jgi:hypothetical protein
MKACSGMLFRTILLVLIAMRINTASAQWAIPPDRPVTGYHNYYFDTYIFHLQLFADGRFRITGEKAPNSGTNWKNIKPFLIEGSYKEEPPGIINFTDSFDRAHFFWVPIGYLASKDLNGHPVLTARYSEKQIRLFPYTQRFGLASEITPTALLYPDGSVSNYFLYYSAPFSDLIEKYQTQKQGAVYPGGFKNFKKELSRENQP